MGPGKPALPGSATKSYVIPKLARDGSNWITWKMQMLVMLAASHGVTQHIEGTTREPPAIPTFPMSQALTQEEDKCLEWAEKQWDKYHQWEAMVKAQIFTTVPELLLFYLFIYFFSMFIVYWGVALC